MRFRPTQMVKDGRLLFGSTSTKLVVPALTSHPAPGVLKLRCKNCGGTAFAPHIVMDKLGGMRVLELVCNNGHGRGCHRVIKLDPEHKLENGGTISSGPSNAEQDKENSKCLTKGLILPQ